MGGWNATGTRVELSDADSSETRRVRSGDNPYYEAVRTVTQRLAEWRGLTKDGARAKNPTAGWKIISRKRVDESNQWVVTEETLDYTEWEYKAIE